MRLKPLFDKVVVKPIEVGETVKNGLYIPEMAKEKPQEGEVIAVGTGRLASYPSTGPVIDHYTPLTVQEGNRVLYGKYSGTEVEIDGEKLLILREDEILAITEE